MKVVEFLIRHVNLLQSIVAVKGLISAIGLFYGALNVRHFMLHTWLRGCYGGERISAQRNRDFYYTIT